MELAPVLNDFVSTFQRSPENVGKLEFASPPRSIETDLILNADLNDYFCRLRFEGSPHTGGRLNLFLFSPDELVTAQQGWRWITDKSGNLLEDTRHWKDSWIVIADKNGDAIFVDTGSDKVFGSIQKRNFLVGETLAQFYAGLTPTMKVEMDKYDFEVLSDNMDPLPEFLQDVRAAVSATSGDEASQGFMKFFFD
jgi:hypothetical protein